MDRNCLTRNEDITAVRNPERILCDGRQISVASSTKTLVRSLPSAPELLEAALKEVATPVPINEGEDSFDTLGGRPVSEERP